MFGIATVPVEVLNITEGISDGSDLRGPVRDDCLVKEDGPSASDRPLRARSAGVRNFLSNSARVVGEAPLILVPLIIVMLSVFG